MTAVLRGPLALAGTAVVAMALIGACAGPTFVPVVGSPSATPPAQSPATSAPAAPSPRPPTGAPAASPVDSDVLPYEAPTVTSIVSDGPCWNSTAHTYAAEFTVSLSGGEGWELDLQAGQHPLPGGTSFEADGGIVFMDWPPTPDQLTNGMITVTYPALGDIAFQVIATADGSVNMVYFPDGMSATTSCAP